MSYETDKINLWKKELRAAVDSNDVETFRKFYAKWTRLGIYELQLPNDDFFVKKIMEKMKNMMI